jgi:hypothetical protein
MTLEPGHYITLGLSVLTFIGWLVRLEGKVEANKKAIADQDRATIAHVAKAEAEARGTRETREALIRMEEQIKHLTDLVERLVPSRRKPAE